MGQPPLWARGRGSVCYQRQHPGLPGATSLLWDRSYQCLIFYFDLVVGPHVKLLKISLITVVLAALTVWFLLPYTAIREAPVSPALWPLVLISAAANIAVIFYHYAVPPHPKFTMIPWRRWVLRVHITSGTLEMIAGLLACFHPDPVVASTGATIAALAALGFHVPSALVQTRIVFGSQAIMWPAYILCIVVHAFCAGMLLTNPDSRFWAVNTFLVFNIYVWCRVYFYIFDWLKLFSGMKYTISILAAGVTIIPGVLGPLSLLFIGAFVGVYVLLMKAFFFRDKGLYQEFVREKARDSAIRRDVVDLLHVSDPAADRHVARRFFDAWDEGGVGILPAAAVARLLPTWGISTSLADAFVARHAKNGGIDFETFFTSVWSIGAVRTRATRAARIDGAKSDSDKALLVFKELDVNQDGLIALMELQLLLLEWGLPETEAGRYIARCDKDGDGVISFDEFFRNMRPVWRFIWYDIVTAEAARGETEMIGRFVSSVKDELRTSQVLKSVQRELLEQVPFLKGAQPALIADLASSLAAESVAKGAVLFREGEPGDRFFVIGSGELRISKEGETIAVLGGGGCVGEGALLSEDPRSATATAHTDARLYALTRASFDFIIDKHPGVREQLRGLHAARFAADVKRTLERTLLGRVPFLTNANEALLQSLASSLVAESVPAGQALFREGDVGDRLYLVAAGAVRITKEGETLAELGVGGCFGEGALLSAEARAATATTTADSRLFILTRAGFDAVVAAHPGVRDDLRGLLTARRAANLKRTLERGLIARVPFLKDADSAVLDELSQGLVLERFSAGATLLREGDDGDRCYLIGSGAVRITKAGDVLAEVGAGACIGEGALLTTSLRTATATAADDVVAYSLERAVFHRILEQHPTVRAGILALHAARTGTPAAAAAQSP